MKYLITILLLGLFVSSEAQNVNQSQIRQFNAVPAYRVFGRGSGVGSPSFIQLDSNHIPLLHSQGYYDGRYQPLGSGSTTDNASYHTATTLPDSTGFTLNRPNGTKDTIQIAIPATVDTTNKWVNNIYKLPNDANIYFKIGGTTYSIKDSVGGGGTGTAGLDTSAIHKTGDETIRSGVKTFASSVTTVGGAASHGALVKMNGTLTASIASDTLSGIYLNPTFAGSATNFKWGIYSTRDFNVNGVRIGNGNSTDATNAVMGKQALEAVTTGTSNGHVAIGYQALQFTTNASFNNTAVGYIAGRAITTGTSNTAIGTNALSATSVGVSNNVAAGLNALSQVTGNNNIGIGTSAGRNSVAGGIFIGNGAGQNETGSNKLYVANNNFSAPIYGDLSTGQLVVNSRTTPNQGTVIAAAQFQVNNNPLNTNRGSIPAPRMPQAQRDLIAVQQGVLTDIIMTSNGTGCSSSATVAITGGGSGATATATFNTGTQYISITSGGTGYTPGSTTITFSGGGCATAPTGVAIIGAEGLSVYCTDCTATDGTRGVLQYYNGSATSPWKNAW